MKSTKWVNSAKRRRIQDKFRDKLCRLTGYDFDCCASTGEILKQARQDRNSRAAFYTFVAC